MEKSVAEQEKELGVLLRRARSTADKSSSTRREFLKRLIDLSHSPHPALKKFAAVNFKECFKDFPEFEDDVINAIYDLCEDPDPQVRMKGYDAISDVSAVETKWVKRNVDVLVQLLQTDDRDEVIIVKKALSRHMDLDTRATWGVFIDQICPVGEPADLEEREARDRIRALVLAYLAGEARPHIQRHVVHAENEAILVDGLQRAILRLSASDVTVMKDILLQLPSYKPSSARGHELLRKVFEKLQPLLATDPKAPAPTELSNDILYYLNLANELAVTKRVAHPYFLLKFYQTHLLQKPVLSELSRDHQLLLICNAVDTFVATREVGDVQAPADGPNSADLDDLVSQVVGTTGVIFDVLAESKLPDDRSMKACYTILVACDQCKKASKWTIPHRIADLLRRIQADLENKPSDKPDADARAATLGLIRSLLAPAPANMPPTNAAGVQPPAKGQGTQQISKRAPKRNADEDSGGRAKAPRWERAPASPAPTPGPRDVQAPRAPREDRAPRRRTRTPPTATAPASAPTTAPVAAVVPPPVPVPASSTPAVPTAPAVLRARVESAPTRPPSRPQADREANGRGAPPLSIVGAARGARNGGRGGSGGSDGGARKHEREPGAPVGDAPRSPKRAKKGAGEEGAAAAAAPELDAGAGPASLLSRLHGKGRSAEPEPAQRKVGTETARVTPPPAEKRGEPGLNIKGSSNASGLSIKGAARREQAPSEERSQGVARASSLLSRMGNVNIAGGEREAVHGSGGGGGGGGRRNEMGRGRGQYGRR